MYQAAKQSATTIFLEEIFLKEFLKPNQFEYIFSAQVISSKLG
jgi:hypothetical protein